MKTLRHTGARTLAAACAFVAPAGVCAVALFAGSHTSCACGE